ncbi:MAG: hypothetical protein RL398_2791 [Planctomycetota bacterium]|jgi:hypothetical protein
MRSLAALLTLAVAAAAQAPTQDELLAKKLAAPFLQKAAWHTDWNAAKAAAKQSGRLLFGYFTTVNH